MSTSLVAECLASLSKVRLIREDEDPFQFLKSSKLRKIDKLVDSWQIILPALYGDFMPNAGSRRSSSVRSSKHKRLSH